MMKYIYLVTMLFTAHTQAESSICTYVTDPTGISLEWTAFKTPKKVGVKGTFKDITVSAKKSKSMEKLLLSTSFTVNTASVDTGKPERDEKINTFFFKVMKKNSLRGKILSVQNNEVTVELAMNGEKHPVVLKMTEEQDSIQLVGSLDVTQWSMASSVESLNKACLALHEGKTWPDVDLNIKAKIIKSCK
jgi:polyisoprenoid-binding protein YceI